MLDVQVVVLAKQPVAGRSKTRLCPPLTLDEAAQVARAALLDTLDVVLAAGAERPVVVLEGDREGLVPPAFRVLPQVTGGLDARLAAAFTAVQSARSAPILLIGMDTPQVTAALLDQACAALRDADSVLGLAEDGGWWACGLRTADPEVFLGVPMSTDHTGREQLARLEQRGRTPTMLPVLRDIDDVADLAAVAALMPPGSRLPDLAAHLLAGAARPTGGQRDE